MLFNPPRCPICGSIDIINNRCTHCGSDINQYKEDNE